LNLLGVDAETRALKHLQLRKLKLLARNWRGRSGELDLVMLDGEVAVVVEVRARRHTGYGGAAASIDTHKQQRIVKTTQAWLLAHPQHARRDLRFDVVAIDGDAIEWIRSAFDAYD
jgi:putative endonuclease